MSQNKIYFHWAFPSEGTQRLSEMFNKLSVNQTWFAAYAADTPDLLALYPDNTAAIRIFRLSDFDYVPYGTPVTPAAAIKLWLQIKTIVEQKFKDKGIDPKTVWIELFNEPSKEPGEGEKVALWLHAVALAANSDGYKLCGPGWASGTPEPGMWLTEAWQEYLKLCAKRPDSVAVTIHEYSYDVDIKKDYPWLIGRLRFIEDACEKIGIAMPTIFVTEVGWTLWETSGNTSDIMWLDEVYQEYPTVKAAFMWTLFKGEGQQQELARQIAKLIPFVEQYSLDTKDEPAPPVEPPPIVVPPDPGTDVLYGPNILRNPSFEEGWTDLNGAQQEPNEWELSYDNGGTDKISGQPYSMPEGVHKFNTGEPGSLPPDEYWMVLDGKTTYKLFGGDKAFAASLGQLVDFPEPGTYELEINMVTDVYRGERDYTVEPNSAMVAMVVDGHWPPTEWRNLLTTPPYEGQVKRTEKIPFAIGSKGPHWVHAIFRCPWQISNNLFLDDWSVRKMNTVIVEPEPPVVVPPITPPAVDEVLNGIDISYWQGAVNEAKFAGAVGDRRIQFMIIRGMYGTAWDARVREYVALARKYNVPFGLYHYFVPWQDPIKQADAFLAQVIELGTDLGVMLDLEEQKTVAPCNGATDPNQTIKDLPERARKYVAHVNDYVETTIYTSGGYWRGYVCSPTWGRFSNLWIAAWTTADRPLVPEPWDSWDIWQYAVDDVGRAYGFSSTNLDLNRMKRSSFNMLQHIGYLPPATVDVEQPLHARVWEAGVGKFELDRDPTSSIDKAMLANGYSPVGDKIESVDFLAQPAADVNNKRMMFYRAIGGTVVYWTDGVNVYPVSPPVVSGPTYDLRTAFRPVVNGAGPWIVLDINSGERTEDVQHLNTGVDTYIIKGGNEEHLRVSATGIYRLEDTSMDDTRYYYELQEKDGSPHLWLPAQVKAGEWYTRHAYVQLRNRGDCSKFGEPKEAVTYAILNRVLTQTIANKSDLKIYEILVTHSKRREDLMEGYWFAENVGLVKWWDKAGHVSIAVDFPSRDSTVPLVLPCS